MKAIDHVGNADGQADVDDLFLAEVAFELAVSDIVYRFETRRFLGITNYRRFFVGVNVRRQRVICEMAHFVV